MVNPLSPKVFIIIKQSHRQDQLCIVQLMIHFSLQTNIRYLYLYAVSMFICKGEILCVVYVWLCSVLLFETRFIMSFLNKFSLYLYLLSKIASTITNTVLFMWQLLILIISCLALANSHLFCFLSLLSDGF